jgi:hypothetical protein
MRLLLRSNTGETTLTGEFIGDDTIPPYAIASHIWNDDEVTFKDLQNGTGKETAGYAKISFFEQQAACDGLQYFWVDTCCIDKSNQVALGDAINSMFYWYQNAAKCYVYLSDVSATKRKASSEDSEYSWELAFRESRWFTRGWTLQELLAPRSVEFFSREGIRLGDKSTLQQTLHEMTGIATQALEGRPLAHFSVRERLSWAANRRTSRGEDQVYCLLGLFGVKMTMLYGEGSWNASLRLWDEILRKIEDYTILLWIRPSDAKYDWQSAIWNPFTPHPTLAAKRTKDTSEKLEWRNLKRHSLLDLASTKTLAGHLPPIRNMPQGPQRTTHGLRMTLFVKVFGTDLIAWTYCSQEWDGRTFAVCIRVIPSSSENLAETPHLKGYVSGEVYHVDVSRLKGFELKTLYFAMNEQ